MSRLLLSILPQLPNRHKKNNSRTPRGEQYQEAIDLEERNVTNIFEKTANSAVPFRNRLNKTSKSKIFSEAPVDLLFQEVFWL